MEALRPLVLDTATAAAAAATAATAAAADHPLPKFVCSLPDQDFVKFYQFSKEAFEAAFQKEALTLLESFKATQNPQLSEFTTHLQNLLSQIAKDYGHRKPEDFSTPFDFSEIGVSSFDSTPVDHAANFFRCFNDNLLNLIQTSAKMTCTLENPPTKVGYDIYEAFKCSGYSNDHTKDDDFNAQSYLMKKMKKMKKTPWDTKLNPLKTKPETVKKPLGNEYYSQVLHRVMYFQTTQVNPNATSTSFLVMDGKITYKGKDFALNNKSFLGFVDETKNNEIKIKQVINWNQDPTDKPKTDTLLQTLFLDILNCNSSDENELKTLVALFRFIFFSNSNVTLGNKLTCDCIVHLLYAYHNLTATNLGEFPETTAVLAFPTFSEYCKYYIESTQITPHNL